MEEENETRENWENYKKGQQTLYRQRNELLMDEKFKDLAFEFFNNPSERWHFLSFCCSLIHFEDQEFIKIFINEITEAALLDNPTGLMIARFVLKKLDNNWLKANLDAIINKILNEIDSESEQEWAYSRTADLLYYLGFDYMLKAFLENCKIHTNPEINSIVDFYSND
ncbi:hypothetical protein [Emticicia sp. 21SJ11W-3]|uniref:hypothetical protein n=1 Tax=Emticicia sp. 21SJ11W-3 TaxID=2916755 RepID=UPI0020A141BE|nr:hypothetical protein [Emticicia sp. 21SJ11W-3]UTA66503.1 hypothetical protein MB380_12925 [Emticicia sp. 21SJ11W-3]